MAKGKTREYIPSANPVVGFIEEYINDVPQGQPHFVFKYPEGLADKSNPPAVNDMVTFTKGNGQTASNVAKEQVPLGILDFQASSNSDGSHLLAWRTQGAVSAKILPGNIDVTNKLPDGSITITNPTATTYTLTVYDSAGNSNSASDSV
ncbi:MAG: hypothetical protein HYY40_12405 [Bacteroidetes bacterium]|nr:hypothetical protein [Bacteroidota bacterium]